MPHSWLTSPQEHLPNALGQVICPLPRGRWTFLRFHLHTCLWMPWRHPFSSPTNNADMRGGAQSAATHSYIAKDEDYPHVFSAQAGPAKAATTAGAHCSRSQFMLCPYKCRRTMQATTGPKCQNDRTRPAVPSQTPTAPPKPALLPPSPQSNRHATSLPPPLARPATPPRALRREPLLRGDLPSALISIPPGPPLLSPCCACRLRCR